MCLAIILKNFSKNKSENHKVNLDEAIDLKINYQNSYFCSYLGERHLVLSFDIQNKSEEKLNLQLKLLPSGKMTKEIRWAMKTPGSNKIIYPSSAGQKAIKASYDDNPFEIDGKTCENGKIIIVKEFNINVNLQLIVISGDEKKTYGIDINCIGNKAF